jgi:peptidoglycan/LPS O-acetylase OafA/YrhL
MGVTIFFFLSGYLITTLMLAEGARSGNIGILSFYVRRIFRLAPPLIITLAIAYSLTYFGWLSGQITLEALTAQLLYFANYYIIFFDPNAQTMPAGTGIIWSLAIEEHFYIFFPLLMAVFVGRAWRPSRIGAVLIIACLTVLAWRIHLVRSPQFFSDRTYLASDTRVDSIIYGCLMAFLINPLRVARQYKKMSLAQWTLFSVGIGLLIFSLIYRDPVFRETFRYSIQGIALFPIFYFSIRFHENAPFRYLNSSWVARIGIYSYTIYLAHQIIIMALEQNVSVVRDYPLLIFPAALLISIAYAAVIDSFVDPYFRKLRSKFRSAKRPTLIAPDQNIRLADHIG